MHLKLLLLHVRPTRKKEQAVDTLMKRTTLTAARAPIYTPVIKRTHHQYSSNHRLHHYHHIIHYFPPPPNKIACNLKRNE